MVKSVMKKGYEYLCFTKRDDSGKVIRDNYGNLVPDYKKEVVYRVSIIENDDKYEWCIHHEISAIDDKRWAISDCGTGLWMLGGYRTCKEAYEHINEELLARFLEASKTDYYKEMYNRLREIKYKARKKRKA